MVGSVKRIRLIKVICSIRLLDIFIAMNDKIKFNVNICESLKAIEEMWKPLINISGSKYPEGYL
jgi:hypothetical protein